MILILLILLGLSASCSGSRQTATVSSAVKFSAMTEEETLAVARKLIGSGEMSAPGLKAPFVKPEDLVQGSNLRGAAINGADHIIYLAASEGPVTGQLLPLRPDAAGSEPEFALFNGILYCGVDVETIGNKVLRLNESNQWQPSDGKIPKGEYRWHVAASGIFIGQIGGGFFIKFQTPLQGKSEYRYKVDFVVDEKRPEQLFISVANQQINITGKPSGSPAPTPPKVEAPNAIVEGIAAAKDSQTPLKNISVKLVSHEGVNFQEKQRTTTDESGHFRFSSVAAGHYVLGGPSMKGELDYLTFERADGSMAEVSAGSQGTYSFGTIFLPAKRKP